MSTIAPTATTFGYKTTTMDPTKDPGELDKNAFLELLAAQMQFQDPLQPVADNAFISQLAQFSSLEQVTNLSTEMMALRFTLEQGQAETNALGALSLIGMQATVKGEDDTTLTGTVDAVKLLASTILLSLGGEDYDLSQVQEIRRPEPASP